MSEYPDLRKEEFDRTNAIFAGLVFFFTFVVYAITVQRSFSFWDCGEFIACAYTLGIPHPPGTPLFVIIGRIFSIIPFVEDISHRINYISVISSAATAMFSYLLTVRIVRYFSDDPHHSLSRFIAYVGGIAGGLFVAFGRTNWANSVEAEVYGLALALSVAIVWLTVKYWEQRGSVKASKWMILAFYLATLGIGVHMTVFLVVPVCAVFYVLKSNATARDYLIICGFMILELLLVIAFSDGRGGPGTFFAISAFLGVGLLALLYRKIHWAVVVAVISISSVMMSFSAYEKITPIALLVLLGMAIFAKRTGIKLKWKTGLTILVVGFIGISVHAFIPIRSSMNPRIDENNPSRDYRTFMNFLDRRQYGQQSMVDRMFNRRGGWSNQLGRHAHMGYWSYFEEQWSEGGWTFILGFFALGLIGLITAIFKRAEIGMPFFTLFLACSLGLVLYMNFADGTHYNLQSGDAYLEVRNRDYFFTPAFVFFGIAMGLGVSSIMNFIRNKMASVPDMQKTAVYASAVLLFLPGISFAHNYQACDRSDNFLPYNYAANILDTCEKDAILFTSGDNDTFPVWCLQEVYGYRLDVRVVNLSLLNTDWYTEQMKNRYGVPMSLSDSQILWHPYEVAPGIESQRPAKTFYDRARQRHTYLQPQPFGNRVVRVQDMMVDDIVWESIYRDGENLRSKYPIYFSSPPYAESPLGLRDKIVAKGILYYLDWNRKKSIDVDAGYDLFMNQYLWGGYGSSEVYRDENATGVFVSMGVNAGRVYDQLIADARTEDALKLAHKVMDVYPEYWQMVLMASEQYDKTGQRPASDSLWNRLHDSLTAFLQSNPENLYYMQDLGVVKMQMGTRFGDNQMITEGIDLAWDAFMGNPNSNFAFRKLISVLARADRDASGLEKLQQAINLHSTYKVNLQDPYLKQLMGASMTPSGGPSF